MNFKDMNVKVLYEFKNQNLKFNIDKCWNTLSNNSMCWRRYTKGIERDEKDVLFYHHIISWMEQQEQKNCMPDRIPTFDSQTAGHWP